MLPIWPLKISLMHSSTPTPWYWCRLLKITWTPPPSQHPSNNPNFFYQCRFPPPHTYTHPRPSPTSSSPYCTPLPLSPSPRNQSIQLLPTVHHLPSPHPLDLPHPPPSPTNWNLKPSNQVLTMFFVAPWKKFYDVLPSNTNNESGRADWLVRRWQTMYGR